MQSLSYITHIIDNNDLSKSLICLSTYSHLDWEIKIHVWAIGIHCFEVVAKYYQQWQSHCFKQLQTVWPHMWWNCLCILKLNSPSFKQIQTVSPCMQSNCLCILKLNSYCFKQIQSVWPCMWSWVLWVYQETCLLPWISMIFSVALTQNLPFSHENWLLPTVRVSGS